MTAIVFLNSLSLGGTEKAACLWASRMARRALGKQIHGLSLDAVEVVSLSDGPRRIDLKRAAVPLVAFPPPSPPSAQELAAVISGASVIHAHAPGFPHEGDILGEAINLLGRKIPLVQTNIFGKLENPKEDAWTDFRLFISWTSCVQAARRSGRALNLEFFRRQSVASYPVEAIIESEVGKLKVESERFRDELGLNNGNILFGRFSRPEPNKWTSLVLDAFLAALKENPNIRLLLREPPPEVSRRLLDQGLAIFAKPAIKNHQLTRSNQPPPVLILPATADPHELAVSQMACDVVLHTSSIGESFGYGIAEPMALGKPVITNSVPWHDQAQIELVRHGECGFIASTAPSMTSAILRLASSWKSNIGNQRLAGDGWTAKQPEGRASRERASSSQTSDESAQVSFSQMGENARRHILTLADPEKSTDKVEMAMQCAVENRDNPFAVQDLEMALKTAEYLDKHQWGYSCEEWLWLRSMDAKVQFLRFQRSIRDEIKCFLKV